MPSCILSAFSTTFRHTTDKQQQCISSPASPQLRRHRQQPLPPPPAHPFHLHPHQCHRRLRPPPRHHPHHRRRPSPQLSITPSPLLPTELVRKWTQAVRMPLRSLFSLCHLPRLLQLLLLLLLIGKLCAFKPVRLKSQVRCGSPLLYFCLANRRRVCSSALRCWPQERLRPPALR